MTDRPTLLLEHHLKELKLPSFLREYGKIAAQCAAEGVDHPQYLFRLAELELIDRHQRMVERRIRAKREAILIAYDNFSELLSGKYRWRDRGEQPWHVYADVPNRHQLNMFRYNPSSFA